MSRLRPWSLIIFEFPAKLDNFMVWSYSLILDNKPSAREGAVPSESRVISFSNVEAVDALLQYCTATKRELPSGGIKRLAFSNDSEIKATAEFNGDIPSISFFQNEIAAALILYCNRVGIPVARRALKSLHVTQDSISLQLTMRT